MSWTRFAIAFDLHGDEQHVPTVKAFHRFCGDFKPQRRLIGGDIWDFTALRGGASEKDKRHPLLPDFQAGMEFIEQFKPDTVLLGNHDRRLWRKAEAKEGPASELAATCIKEFKEAAKKLDCRIVPYSKTVVVELGPLNVLHGFFAGENACKRHAHVYGPCIFGHVHTAEHASVPRHSGSAEAWSSPAMVRLDMEYADETPSTLKWQNGWIFGQYNGKAYHVETAVVKNGSVVVADGFKVLAA